MPLIFLLSFAGCAFSDIAVNNLQPWLLLDAEVKPVVEVLVRSGFQFVSAGSLRLDFVELAGQIPETVKLTC